MSVIDPDLKQLFDHVEVNRQSVRSCVWSGSPRTWRRPVKLRDPLSRQACSPERRISKYADINIVGIDGRLSNIEMACLTKSGWAQLQGDPDSA